jgi:phage gpG-like protein
MTAPTWTLDGIEQLTNVVQGVQDQFDRADYAPTFEQELDALRSAHRGFFDSATDPSGAAWKPLAPSTVAKKGHATILVEGTELRESLVGENSSSIAEVINEGANNQHSLVFGTSREFAALHQEGTTRTPQRMHVGLNDRIIDEFVEKLADRAVQELML